MPQQPVAGVSWFEATRYCEWLCTQTGRNYRLPTEAEWECAARGGLEQKNFPWGDEPPQSLPDYATRWQTGPEPVARYAANAFGLYDICDNVHEWCSDWYDPNYYASSPERNPRGPASGPTQGFARRIVAASRESCALLGPLQHPARIPVCGLRLSSSLRSV